MNNQTTPQWLCHFGLRWNLEMVVLGGRGGRGITEYPKETEKLSHNGAKTGTNQKRIITLDTCFRYLLTFAHVSASR